MPRTRTPDPTVEREWRCSIPVTEETPVYATTRSKARYRYWLQLRECCPDLKLTEILVRAGTPPSPPSTAWKELGLSEKQRHCARHALGFDGRQKESYRNHYCIGPGGDTYDGWMDLVEKGLAKRYPPSELSGSMDTFSCTRELALAVCEGYEHLGRGF